MQRSIAVLSLNEICHATVLHLLENFLSLALQRRCDFRSQHILAIPKLSQL